MQVSEMAAWHLVVLGALILLAGASAFAPANRLRSQFALCDAAFGNAKPKPQINSKKPADKGKDVKKEDEKDFLYAARRVTRWIMFPGIFSKFDETEERMKKTIKIESGLTKAEKERLRLRNPEMYE